jgi:ERF superfamily
MENENIYSALARAQATYTVAYKSGYNPHYKSTFSTFEDLVLASRESLTREGLSITQYVESEYDKEYLWTNLMHSTKEHIASKVQIYVKDKTDIQKFGSAITYLKRYMYASICGIATSEHDEDANDVVNEPVVSDKQVVLLKALIKDNKELEETICKHYNVQSLAQILARNMNQIVEKLKNRNQ